MKELTVVTHVTYTYETSDGREFEDECEARQWESQLSLLDDVIMLDFQYEPIKDSESAYAVLTKTMTCWYAISADRNLMSLHLLTAWSFVQNVCGSM